jgi:hypothetical protein
MDLYTRRATECDMVVIWTAPGMLGEWIDGCNSKNCAFGEERSDSPKYRKPLDFTLS